MVAGTPTGELDPTELARLVGKTTPASTRPAIVERVVTEESLPIEMPHERPTSAIDPTELQQLRDQAVEADTRTTELDPSVLRAMIGSDPIVRASPLPPRVGAPTPRWGSTWKVSELAERAITDAIAPLRKSWASEWSTADFELRSRTEAMDPLPRPDGDDLAIPTEQPELAIPEPAIVPATSDTGSFAAPRGRRRHQEARPITKPPETVAARPTTKVRPLTASTDDYAEPPFAWGRALGIAFTLVALLLVFMLTR